jgi:hypothetical protein
MNVVATGGQGSLARSISVLVSIGKGEVQSAIGRVSRRVHICCEGM